MGNAVGASLEKDSVWMADDLIAVKGGGGGGGKMIASSAHHALFGGGTKVSLAAFPFRAAWATSANLFLPLPTISTQNKERVSRAV